MDYIFLQNYWWFLVSLLGALLVFLLFVQGGNSLLFTLGRNDEERALLVNFYHFSYFRGRFLRFFPTVLQYQLRRCLLVVDDYSFQFRIAGCLIRVPIQAGQSAGQTHLPMVSGYKWHCGSVVAGRSRGYFLYRLQFPG